MAKKRKWGPVLAFGAVTAILGGLAAYKHRKEIERTLQEIADQMDAWDGSEEFFHDEDTIVHSVKRHPGGATRRPPGRGRGNRCRRERLCGQRGCPPARPGGSSGSLSAYAALAPTGQRAAASFSLGEEGNTTVDIVIQPAYQQLEAVKALLLEYTSMLLEQNPAAAGSCLQRQNFEGELANLAEKYGAPQGRLYLIRVDGAPAGCAAMKRLDRYRCELKRLYIRPRSGARAWPGGWWNSS